MGGGDRVFNRILHVAAEFKADLLVIGARGHSAVYERIIDSRADRILQLAEFPVLLAKQVAPKLAQGLRCSISHQDS